ncbi:MAG: DUF3810 domain-containing protein [Clostridiaceae bacterium]|nr:DUF3810 domain-containing protein [Clostridiaceae bacterium]
MAAISFLLLILAQVAKRVAAGHPAFVEKYFSRGLYRVTSRIQLAIINPFRFSFYELIIVCLVLFGLYRFYRLIQSVFRKTFKEESIRFGTQVFSLVCVGLFLFQFTWSLNNYRIPLKDQLSLSVQETSVTTLAKTYQALVQSANEARSMLPAVNSSDSKKIRMILDTAWEGYPPLAQKYSVFHSQRVRVKGLYLFSWIQTVSGYSGVYNFFTGEANINIHPPLVTLPHTACHEIAHQMGINMEDEANYAGFLACMNHPDDLFRYSGYLSALTYTGNALYKQSPEVYTEISALISDEIRADQQEIREFWEKNQKKGAAEIADRLNEAYLKSNNQPEGMQSYGRFVDLLIADYLQDQKI